MNLCFDFETNCPVVGKGHTETRNWLLPSKNEFLAQICRFLYVRIRTTPFICERGFNRFTTKHSWKWHLHTWHTCWQLHLFVSSYCYIVGCAQHRFISKGADTLNNQLAALTYKEWINR